jgi:hypothetical protein
MGEKPPQQCSGEFDSQTCADEGALPFVATICHSYRDSQYKRERGRHNDRRPSPKSTRQRAMNSCTPGAVRSTSARLSTAAQSE